jgi:hypothetical protein
MKPVSVVLIKIAAVALVIACVIILFQDNFHADPTIYITLSEGIGIAALLVAFLIEESVKVIDCVRRKKFKSFGPRW